MPVAQSKKSTDDILKYFFDLLSFLANLVWLTQMFIQTTAVKLALFSNKNITVNAYFLKTGKFQNSFRRHIETLTNRIYNGTCIANQSVNGAVRLQS